MSERSGPRAARLGSTSRLGWTLTAAITLVLFTPYGALADPPDSASPSSAAEPPGSTAHSAVPATRASKPTTKTPGRQLAQPAPGRTTTDPDQLVWNPDWPRFALPELTFTGAVAAGVVGTYFLINPPDKPRWQGPVLLDGDTRLGLKASGTGVDIAAGISDALLYGLVAMPYFDALYALTVRNSPDVAGQIVLINTQSFAITQLVTGLSKDLIARERPFGADCGDSVDGNCGSADRYRSFMSGHASMAFTGAGLVCAHHQYLDLYDDPTADALACGMAVTAATTVAAARVVADKHYLSDVLAGAAVGAISGYLLPVLLHYGHGGDDDEEHEKNEKDDELGRELGRASRTSGVDTSVLPYASPEGFGLSVSGTF